MARDRPTARDSTCASCTYYLYSRFHTYVKILDLAANQS
jgi:hypothetical protein